MQRLPNLLLKTDADLLKIYLIRRSHDAVIERFPPLSTTQAREHAGNREYVGYYLNGEPSYSDRPDFPYPAIRFQKEEGEILKLREKEKADWRKLSLDEKKRLYRHSFACTIEECLAPKGYWKIYVGSVLFLIGLSCDPVDFKARSNEHKEKILQNMIDTFSEPISGVASKWDYENNRWKA
uniref:Cytochrome c oxidase subunit 4 n=1 Tax=Romanomermis culicivorax TaxID=13658 RepID=A0A915KP03_ROMCU